MKDISEVYKEWCGSDVHTNDCHSVHDSSEAIEFAEEWAAEVVKNLPNEHIRKICASCSCFKDVMLPTEEDCKKCGR